MFLFYFSWLKTILLSVAVVICALSSNVEATSSITFPLLYLDLDGTALDSTHNVLESTCNAVSAYKACGGEVGLATGRILEQATSAIEAIKPTLPLILFNGAVIFDPVEKNSIVLHSLSYESVFRTIKLLENMKFHPDYVLHYATKSTTPFRSTALETFANEHEITLQEEQFSPLESDRASYIRDPVIKILFVCSANIKEEFKSLIANNLTLQERVVISSQFTVEVLPVDANKASAIKTAIALKGYQLNQVVAFGDSENDVEMLREAGLGIAMAGCYPKACEAADLIIGPNSSDAISKMLYYILINEECSNEGKSRK